jgi:DNA polymerase/3'-5' exonuclease PolX
MNQKIIDEFNRLAIHIEKEIDLSIPDKDQSNYFRLKQIKNIIKILKNYKIKIKKGEDLQYIKGIGLGTITRINEIISTGKLCINEDTIISNQNDYSKFMLELEKVIGIGKKTAFDLVTKYNIKSVIDLINAHKNKKINLNDKILLGLKYYNIYKQNIPRSEIDSVKVLLKSIASKIDPHINIVICGSYRRKKEYSNDIDILLTHSNIKSIIDLKKKENILKKFIQILKNKKFILDDITYEEYESKYMGFCKINNNPIRRIDIRYICTDSFYTALLYFTGSSEFNIKMRKHAKDIGFKLNEYGLYKLKNDKEIFIQIHSEKQIFYELGLEYIPPYKR